MTPQRNPFVNEPEVEPQEDPIDDDPILGQRESLRGPRNIQQTLAAEPVEEAEPAAPVAVTSATLWLVGASGGVGTSTLAGLCSENVVDESEHRPARVLVPTPPEAPTSHRVALVTATGAAGSSSSTGSAARVC